MNLEDLLEEGQNNPAGTSIILSFARHQDFDSFAVPTVAPATAAERNVIADPHTLKTGTEMYKLEMVMNENELTAEDVAEFIGTSKKLELNGIVSNISDSALGVLEEANNHNMVAFVHLADGKVIQLGDEHVPARISHNFQSGKNSDGKRGFPIKVMSYGRILRYDSAISYEPVA